MTQTIQAVYENGVFRPTEPVDLPDRCQVEVQVRLMPADSTRPDVSEGLAKIYAILGERYNSGHSDTAARHNEHQP